MPSRPTLRHRLQGRLWQHSQLVRQPLRRLRRWASLALHRLRHRLPPRRATAPQRVVPHLASGSTRRLTHPLLAVGGEQTAVRRFLAMQTETSAVHAAEPAADLASFHLQVVGEVAGLSPTHLESALLAAAAESLPLVVVGWAAPTADRHAVEVHRPAAASEATALMLSRGLPASTTRRSTGVLGRRVPQITAGAPLDAPEVRTPLLTVAGPYLLRADVAPGSIQRGAVAPLDRILADLPEVPGPPTVLFLLPYLAVGGAERLLRDLVTAWPDARVLIVTLEPHRPELGQTVDALRAVTPHVYTLGDWLPREALPGALAHLLRRYRVATLFSWNGTVLFYDLAAGLGRRFPELRIIHQLFHHRGGWTERLTPALRARLDAHVAVNRPIAAALVARGAPASRVSTIHHGVEVPALATAEEGSRRRRQLREELGIPVDAVVAGTFIRLHPQKRPLDILRLARRIPELHFLLVGGGPLDAAVDRALVRDPLRNVTRLALHPDASELYPALDLCLMTSRYEGLPVFLLDGMARGLPAVAPAVGDIPLLFAAGGGVAVARPGDLDALVAALRSYLDPATRDRAGDAARRTVSERFGLDRYRRDYRRLIFPD